MLARRDCIRLLACAAPTWPVLAAGLFPTTVADRVDRRWAAPCARPTGIKATRDGVWLVDNETAKVFLMAYTGEVKAEIETGTTRPTALETDQVGLWVAGEDGHRLIRLEFVEEDDKIDYTKTVRKAEFDAPGVGLVKYGAPGEYMRPTGVHGMAWVRGELYLGSPAKAAIFVVKGQDGSVVRSFPAPGDRPQGLVFDTDGDLWCADGNSRSFFKLDPASGAIIKQHMLPPAEPEVEGKVIVPHGLTYWQRMLYFCSTVTGEIYRTPLINRME